MFWLLLLSPIVFFFAFWYKRYLEADKPIIYGRHSSKFTHLVVSLPAVQKQFFPTWWCPFGFAQTIARQFFRSRPTLSWRREVYEHSDGGVQALDWLEPIDANEKTPLVFFLPGITGSTHDCSYIIHCAKDVVKQGWRCVVVNARGLGGVPLKTAKTYNAAYTDDFRDIVQMSLQRYPDAKKMACGFSLGGMILWNYLAKHTRENCGLLAGMVISSPFDNFRSTASLETFWPRLFFNSHLANCLKEVIFPYKELFEKHLDWELLMKTNTIRGFDANFVVPMFGYNDWEHYYTEATLKTKVSRIPIPVLTLNSSDDCFAPIDSLPLEEISQSENVVAVVTKHGGHTAFMSHHDPNENGLVEPLLLDLASKVFSGDF
ncbi:unnamed protein product, partial [Mesorhabditis belari]|uniref:AB hydrolase-1 domain-containing protein n=1 Tax=Mesorhabditis belari TaxID=2138241 RepID=A0AAF3F8K6_9BILA